MTRRRCLAPRVNDAAVEPHVAAVVKLVRAEGLVPTSTELVDARGRLATDVTDGHAAVLQEAIGPLVALVAADVSSEEAWVCLVVVMQSMLSAHDLPMLAGGAEQWASATKRVFRARVVTFRAGEIENLWMAHRRSIALPTTATWERKQGVSLRRKREAIAKQVAAALDVCDGKRGYQVLADVPSAPPGERQRRTLQDLLPSLDGVAKPCMEAEYRRLDFHRPEIRAAEMHARLATAAARRENAVKWEPVQMAAKVRKQPGGTAVQSSHVKKIGERDRGTWAILNEAIECRAVPVRVCG